MMYWFGGMGLFGAIMMALIWLGLAALIVWAARTFVVVGPRGGDSPLEILKRRFAAGEISEAEYEQARRALGGHGYERL